MASPSREPAPRLVPCPGWSDVTEHAPDGLAVIGDGAFVRVNAAGVALCGRPVEQLIGAPAPFAIGEASSASPDREVEEEETEQVCVWAAPQGTREFAYRARPLPGQPRHAVVAFRDVSAERQRQRRISAIARSSATLASEGSISAILDALAHEVQQADALAAVQILTLDRSGKALQLMGEAGFRRWPHFFDRLMEVRERGGALRMLEAMELRVPVVVPHRWDATRDDPAWEPLDEYHRALNWDWFASVPLIIRGRTGGVLNAFYRPGQVVGPSALEFLVAMAEQAAVALDYAALLQRERDAARREERQRLARDLHDSIVQQVFSIGMQAKAMGVLGAGTSAVPADSVRRIAAEVGTLSQTALTDLRAMVHELRPSASVEGGLGEAIRTLANSTTNRTGLHVRLILGKGLGELPPELAQDAYRLVAEAIHNVVKHADASRATIRIACRHHVLTASITDNGCGLTGSSDAPGDRLRGHGLTSMRERAERWGGSLEIADAKPSGTVVRAVLPAPRLMPVGSPDAVVPVPRREQS